MNQIDLPQNNMKAFTPAWTGLCYRVFWIQQHGWTKFSIYRYNKRLKQTVSQSYKRYFQIKKGWFDEYSSNQPVAYKDYQSI